MQEKIGNFQILRLLGEGGIASVYEAEHIVLGNRVAIKVLNPILSTSISIRERFRNEAKIMASLDHPNIIRVLDFDEQPHQLSITMDLLEGEDLSQRIRSKGPLSENELKNVFGQVLSALQYGHDRNVIHRDIKPSNIFILPNGQVKVLDFGIAKVYGQGSEMTLTGQQIGTPLYMSPEQVRTDKTIDHRTDIYSLGVTMYFSVCGKPPYDTETESQFDIFSRIVYESFPLQEVIGLPQYMIQKACAKDREQRFQQCREWLQVLEQDFGISGVRETFFVAGEKTVVDPARNDILLRSGEASKLQVPDVIPHVRIGDQIWMEANLNVERFRNGEIIPEIRTAEDWKSACDKKQPAWCYYENDPKNGTIYGKLYNFHAVTDPRGLSPQDWHVPTDDEWSQLIQTMGGAMAGKKMKSNVGWDPFLWMNGNGTNQLCFDGRPGGFRRNDGAFLDRYVVGDFWSCSEASNDQAFFRGLRHLGSDVHRSICSMGCGFSVRCVRDFQKI